MISLLSLGTGILFVLLAGKALRKRPVPFYIGAAVIAVVLAAVAWSETILPMGFAKYAWPVFARGGLAGALFVIVMFTGAFPRGSLPTKTLMPIRGQLSILASILTLSHNAAYGKIYFTRLFTDPGSLPLHQLLAAVCSLLMLALMLPLFVTSFRRVRKKMAPGKWKKLQRFAYVFYMLMACHILLLTAPGALRGDVGYRLTVFVYGAIFSSYLCCRLIKIQTKQGKPSLLLARRQANAAFCCVLVSAGAAFCLGREAAGARTGQAQDTQIPALAAEFSVDAAPWHDDALPSDPPGAQSGGKEETANYQDGVYTGSAMGMNAPIEVSVTVENGQIADISIRSAKEDEPYFSEALAVIGDILAANSTRVDTVSGATWSSGGILDAVEAALEHHVF